MSGGYITALPRLTRTIHADTDADRVSICTGEGTNAPSIKGAIGITRAAILTVLNKADLVASWSTIVEEAMVCVDIAKGPVFLNAGLIQRAFVGGRTCFEAEIPKVARDTIEGFLAAHNRAVGERAASAFRVDARKPLVAFVIRCASAATDAKAGTRIADLSRLEAHHAIALLHTGTVAAAKRCVVAIAIDGAGRIRCR